jgi:hypothetical protein
VRSECRILAALRLTGANFAAISPSVAKEAFGA